MDPLQTIIDWVKKQLGSTSPDPRWEEGLHAYQRGKAFLSQKNKEREALCCFDMAIECGYEGGGTIYIDRGICLQALGFDLDAIDDFNKVIPLASEDANLYYMRGLSRGATGDFDGAISDHEEAVRLSKAHSPSNDAWNNYARETGWPSATAFYESYLSMARMNKSFYEKAPEAWQEIKKRDSSNWRRKPQGT